MKESAHGQCFHYRSWLVGNETGEGSAGIRPPNRFARGVTLEPDAARDFAAENCCADSVSQTRVVVVRRVGHEPEIIERPSYNHLGRKVDYFVRAAQGHGTFPTLPAGILQTAVALEAVFKSVDAERAWMDV